MEKYISLVNKNIIISRTNLDGIITDISEAFCKISGFSSEELIGQTHVLMRHEDTPLEVYDNLWKTTHLTSVKKKKKAYRDYLFRQRLRAQVIFKNGTGHVKNL